MVKRLTARLEDHLGLRTAELPRGLVWIYVAGALLTVPVMSRNFFELSPAEKLVSFAGNALPFACVPASVHAAYRFAVPRLLARASTPVARALVHVAVTAGTAAVPALLIYSIVSLLGWRRAPLSGFIGSAVVMTWAIFFPAKLVLAWRHRAEKSEELRRTAHATALKNELYAIQSRAHPHFLFNALNTVAALIPEDPRRAEETLERFADVLRYMLETATAASTSLSADVTIVRDYLEIQRARFGDQLDFSIEVSGGLDGVLAPPLLILPLVENAVLHGVAANGKGRIAVRIAKHGQRLEVVVEDDGPGPGGSSRRGTGVGMRDLQRRLEILYDGEASLRTRRREVGGYGVSLAVPIAVPIALPIDGGPTP